MRQRKALAGGGATYEASTLTHRALATVDLGALLNNYALTAARCPGAALLPVIKANAYGHGMPQVARTLATANPPPAAVAVATLDEALSLHSLALDPPIVLLGGCLDKQELATCLTAGIEPVLHSPHQVADLQAWLAEGGAGPKRIWLKANTGMNRLGLAEADLLAAFAALRDWAAKTGRTLALMTHLAHGSQGLASDGAQRQLRRYAELRQRLAAEQGAPVPASLAASASILAPQDTGCQFVRPGIMLYGGSPYAGATGESLGLEPVMTLSARLIAVNHASAGEAVGYDGAHVCAEATRLGLVSAGYGDGYPRAAPPGTPVLVKSGGVARQCPLVGRVSMDTITVNLNGLPGAGVGDEVVFWGPGLSADALAEAAGTISYELFCRVTPRVRYEYLET